MTTINLPVGTIQSIVNIDDPRVNIPIEDAFNFMQSTNDDKKLIRGMESTVELKSKTNNNQEFNVLNFKHDINYIVKLRKLYCRFHTTN